MDLTRSEILALMRYHAQVILNIIDKNIEIDLDPAIRVSLEAQVRLLDALAAMPIVAKRG